MRVSLYEWTAVAAVATIIIFTACSTLTAGTGLTGTVDLKSQTPCAQAGSDDCVAFTASTASPFMVRQITLAAPGAGSALVTFNGTATCVADPGKELVVTFDTEIVNRRDAEISPDGPGGARFDAVHAATKEGTTTGFNLAASRVFSVTKGNHNYFVALSATMVGANVTCSIFNATLTVLFVS